jgi:cyclophilin family peptidyl-prolyl cis-trans isomerase/HEAT repeat protein
MVLRRWSLLLGVGVAVLAARCAGSHPPATGTSTSPPTATPSPTATPVAVPTGMEAQAALLELEDRRSFDEPLLRAFAGSADPSTRARAAFALGRIGDERGEEILRPLLRDPASEVRSAAAFAASLVPSGSLSPDLVPLLADPEPSVATAAAKALGFLARPEGEDALVATTANPATAPELRAAALRSLWRFSNPASETASLRWVSDADPRIRYAAAFALARKPHEGSQPSLTALTALLSDAIPDVAAIAARGLGVLGRPESVEPLGRVLSVSGRTPVIIQALVALDQTLAKNPTSTLADPVRARVLELSSDANANLAVSALVLVRRFAASDRDAARRLWSIALSGEGRRRQVAIESLVIALGAGAEAALTSAAASNDRFLRAAAAEAAGGLPSSEARAWRERFAADRDVAVRLANLGTLRDAAAVRESRALVNSALTDPDAGVRSAAVEALGLLADPALVPLYADSLVKAAADSSSDVALAVVGACEKIHTDPAAASLVAEIAAHGKTLAARIARRALVATFGSPASSLPSPEYETGKTRGDYAALLASARRPWRARIETSAGSFTIRFAGDWAPMTVMYFVSLAQKGYFDGVTIHRVVPNFVFQDGDPTGTGNGGPGYEIRDELNPLEYTRGTVGMALSGPDTGGSQWFVTHSPQPHLNGIYTVFGQIVDGQAAVERIGQGERILHVTITEGS